MMAARGWTAPTWPKAYGGGELSRQEAAVLQQEIARLKLPTPLAGMGLSMVLMPLFVGLFGAMEVMLPVMLSAMLAGMAFGMAGAMYEPGTTLVLAGGGLTGILTLLLTYAADAGIRARNR